MPQGFGRYWLHEKIGEGGMAAVYRATLGPNPKVYAFELAIKRIREELLDQDYCYELFAREATIAEQLSHPNVIRTYEVGETDGRQYIAMELMNGMPLSQLNERCKKRGQPLGEGLVIHIGLQVLRALDYIHDCSLDGFGADGIVHRDITPSNIHLLEDGSVKLVDFGVAQVGGWVDPYMLRGKLRYIAPEAMTDHTIGPAGDLWSLGACLYETLTGRRLHGETADEQIILNAGSFKPPSARQYRDAAISEPVVEAVTRMLDRRPARRPEQAAHCYRLLKSAAREAGLQADGRTLAAVVQRMG